MSSPKNKYQVIIVGGGTAGITVAAQLSACPEPPEIAIIEPSDKHYYQPLWTLVGGGVFPKDASERAEADCMPAGVHWIREKVRAFEPRKNIVHTENGESIAYDYLVVAAGIQVDWEAIPGLKEGMGKNGICSNYAYQTVETTWDNIRNFRGGTALFTQPAGIIKCGGAPQKICYLAEHYFRKIGVRQQSTVMFNIASETIFAVEKYARSLEKVAAEKGVEVNYQHNLVELNPDKKEALFAKLDTNEQVTVKYDMIHVTPPMSAPDFIEKSPLAAADGWVEVDQYTLQHTRFDNVFAIGDCSSLPTSKTGAAIRKQAPVLVHNLMNTMNGSGQAFIKYDGYTSCPLVTGYGSLILAEFDYDKMPCESFPFDQAQERYSMYAFKAYGLPRLYWHGMLKGRL